MIDQYSSDQNYKSILIIDDEQFIRDIFSQFLSEAGYNIQSVASNDEAINFLTQNTYDLILVDIHMNGLSFHMNVYQN